MAAEIWIIDIETAPHEVYSWGLFNQNHSISQIIKPGSILCFSAMRWGAADVESHAAWDDERAMLKRLHQIYDSADYVVGYNQARFDNRWVRASLITNGFDPPSPHRDVDLLKTVRKQFMFPSNKLDYVAGALGLGHKLHHQGQGLWNEAIRPSTPKKGEQARAKMVKYCAQDVRLTGRLFDKLLPWVDGFNQVLVDGTNPTVQEDLRCVRCGSEKLQKRGWAHTTTYRYQRYQCQGCKGWLKDRKSVATTHLRLA